MRSTAVTEMLERGIAEVLQDFARPCRSIDEVAVAMRTLIERDLADLPMPGSGRTLERWRALAAVGACDLSLAKVYEGHTDAVAILAELGGPEWAGLWAVWAAEPPSARVTFDTGAPGGTLSGRKAWCSGAAVVDCAVVSAWTRDGQPVLVAVHMDQPGIHVEPDGWNAVGMAASQSVAVDFDGVPAVAVGAPGAYVARSGFWQGGAGIAAVWYGATVAIAEVLERSARISGDPHAAAHLGAIDTTLRSVRSLLVETATWIDDNPAANASAAALRVRAAVEAAANEVLERTGRSLGPAPLCTDAAHAQRCADLPVFLRQSHAEHDLAALGRAVAILKCGWAL